MNTFCLTVSTPDGNAFEGEVAMLTLRGMEGELAIMAGHIPLMTPVVACDCKLTLADDTEHVTHIEGGILSVAPSEVTLLTGFFRIAL